MSRTDHISRRAYSRRVPRPASRRQGHSFVSGDFAGYAQAHIEREHPGAQALNARYASIELPLVDPPTRAEIGEILSSRRGRESQAARTMLRVRESGESLPAVRDYELCTRHSRSML